MAASQPSIYISGIRIDEPVTMFTDLAISLVCFYAFLRLSRIACNDPDHVACFFCRGVRIIMLDKGL